MAGFSDHNIYKEYAGSVVYDASSAPGGSPSLKIPLTDLVDSASIVWPDAEIFIQIYNSQTEVYTDLLPTDLPIEWQKDGSYLYIQPLSYSGSLNANKAYLTVSIFRIQASSQDYSGDNWNTLTPVSIAEALDKATRMAQRALFESQRALKVHPQDSTAFDTFDGENLPGKLTIPRSLTRANRAIGFDATGENIIAIGANITAVADELNTPGTAIIRDTNGFANVSGVNIQGQATEPSFSAGKLWYDTTDNVLKYYNDIAGTSVDIGEESRLRAYNNTGSTILNGQVVYINGAYAPQKRTTIALAKADAIATSDSCIGIATHDIANGTDGVVCISGLVRDVNTNSFNDGDPLYLSTATAGALTNVRPTTGLIVRVGFVAYKHASQGRIMVAVQQIGGPFPGTVVAYAGSSVPTGWLLCDGSAGYSTTTYAALFAAIGYTYGGSGASFSLPDYKESALVGVGTRGSGIAAFPAGSHDTYTLGQFKDDAFQGSGIDFYVGNTSSAFDHLETQDQIALAANSGGRKLKSTTTGSQTIFQLKSDGTNGTPRTGTVTRGKRIGVNYIIKY